jgi:hypothetical protein
MKEIFTVKAQDENAHFRMEALGDPVGIRLDIALAQRSLYKTPVEPSLAAGEFHGQ